MVKNDQIQIIVGRVGIGKWTKKKKTHKSYWVYDEYVYYYDSDHHILMLITYLNV